MTKNTTKHFGLMALLGIPIGIISAFVKWGGEFPFPPRSPHDMFEAACGPESLIRSAEQIDCSRNFLNPPYVFLRDYLGVSDPYGVVWEFAGHIFNNVMLTHIIFSIIFAIFYCVLAEKFPKITLAQGVLAGIIANIAVHIIVLPILGLTPPLFTLPWYEHFSEFFGHIIWVWSIEIMRRDLRNRITKEKDPTD